MNFTLFVVFFSKDTITKNSVRLQNINEKIRIRLLCKLKTRMLHHNVAVDVVVVVSDCGA